MAVSLLRIPHPCPGPAQPLLTPGQGGSRVARLLGTRQAWEQEDSGSKLLQALGRGLPSGKVVWMSPLTP